MKKIFKNIMYIGIGMLSLSLTSCEDYLDKSPESNISSTEAYKNFVNFQGFVEELYCCNPEMNKPTWFAEFNMADGVISTSTATYMLNSEFDTGNYWAWICTNSGWNNSFLDQTTANTDQEAHNKGLWPLAWYGIRKANQGLENIDKMTGTEEEINTIKGQLLFFRGFFHFQLMSYWGGLPYIDHLLTSSETLNFPRLTYKETALKAAEDFEAAAKLLPDNWDNSTVGQATLNKNYQRINSSTALAYLGKDLLYAASPMMNEASGGSNDYDQELCIRAASAFNKVIELSRDGKSPYSLQTMENYHNNFWRLNNLPGRPEVIMAPPVYQASESRWSLTNMYVPPELGGEAKISAPAANYVDNYGMANGLPIDDPESGYDPTHPWDNRDPRFYNDITYDGCKMIQEGGGDDQYRYAELFTGGNLRNETSSSRTGYLMKKWICDGANKWDNVWGNIVISAPYLRLSDVYLMYAEATMYGYNSTSETGEGTMNAVDAINVVRERAGIPDLTAKYSASVESLKEALIRERAVEFAFEGIRFMDLRRWNIAGQEKYLNKTSVEFTRGNDGQILNLHEKLVVKRVFQDKHKWLPLPTDQVNIYPSFGQNPGW